MTPAYLHYVQAKKQMYVDPSSGYKVFTEYAHLHRGKCCGSACRHVSSLFSILPGCSLVLFCSLHCFSLHLVCVVQFFFPIVFPSSAVQLWALFFPIVIYLRCFLKAF